MHTWKEHLAATISRDEALGIDGFETTINLKKQGKIEDKVFAETRLRRGVYGQRYDNGHRNDGAMDRVIPFPSPLTKGPGTAWDAPGMLRIKIPFGLLTTQQMLELANIAEEYSDDILHITTRQDFQLHYIHIEDTPDIFRRLAGVGITTLEACGNTIRNITGCPTASVCAESAFDVTPYADQAFQYLLGHPDCQDFGRKFKIAFSGCADKPCGLAQMHDIGFIAKTVTVDGKTQNGFRVVVGGGLGAVPVQAKEFFDFMPADDLLKFCRATARVFARYGEKKNRNRARMKFLINDWGIEKFKETVLEEMKTMPAEPVGARHAVPVLANTTSDPSNTAPNSLATSIPGSAQQSNFSNTHQSTSVAVDEHAHGKKHEHGHGMPCPYTDWRANNVAAQRQPGFYTVTIALPLGDITANQLRKLALILPKYINDTIRTSVEQNLVLLWVKESDLNALHDDLKKLDLHHADYGTIMDMTACPGTDTCKLGISSSRGLAAELRHQMIDGKINLPASAKNLKIKMSGCFNSCGQHHIADIGFYGVARKVGDYMVPFFQLMLGGQTADNAGSYGLAAMAIPSKAVPKALERLTKFYDEKKEASENFQKFVERQGKVAIKNLLDDLTQVPAYDADPTCYTDWGSARTFSKKDIGIGECAGEVVSKLDFGLAEAERQTFAAQVALESNDLKVAHDKAQNAMLSAAVGLISERDADTKTDYATIKNKFQTLFVDTQVFNDPFAGDKFAKFFTNPRVFDANKTDKAATREFIEEAILFIEACHAYNLKKESVTPS